MHVELVDLFRCGNLHEDSWLVAAFHDVRERVVVNGVLGCPVCGAEFPIENGNAGFASLPSDAGNAPSGGITPPGEDEVFRLAALLDLDAPGKTIALIGYPAPWALALEQVVPTRVVMVDATLGEAGGERDVMPWYPHAPAAFVTCGDRLPIATASLHGIATMRAMPLNVATVLRPQGRLVAPVSSTIPSQFTQLALDNRQWVAERDMGSPMVTLRRQSPES